MTYKAVKINSFKSLKKTRHTCVYCQDVRYTMFHRRSIRILDGSLHEKTDTENWLMHGSIPKWRRKHPLLHPFAKRGSGDVGLWGRVDGHRPHEKIAGPEERVAPKDWTGHRNTFTSFYIFKSVICYLANFVFVDELLLFFLKIFLFILSQSCRFFIKATFSVKIKHVTSNVR